MPRKKDTIIIQEELERRILHGLACEWEKAHQDLGHIWRPFIRKPLISLRDMKSRLGYWSGKKQEICMNRDFVLNHPWDSIRDVLRHEIAHQLAYQGMGGKREKPHGPSFQRACHILRADPGASGKYKTLQERLERGETDENDKILVKVKKLMALAQSKNSHEAEAAMIKAHALVKKYNIDLLAHKPDRNFISVFVGKPALRHLREYYQLSHLLMDYYFVDGIWIPAYVMEKGKMGRVLEISGTAYNIKISGYVHDFVQRFIDARWLEYNRDKKLNRYRKTDFAIGIIQGFREKLDIENIRKEMAVKEFSLVKVEDPLLKKYMKYRYPRTTSFSRTASSTDVKVMDDGVEIGKKLVIYKGVSETGKSGKLLPDLKN